MNFFQLVSMMKNGGNPQQLLETLMSNNQVANNPMAKNAMDLFSSGDIKGLENMARNLSQSKGVNIEDIRKQLGI